MTDKELTSIYELLQNKEIALAFTLSESLGCSKLNLMIRIFNKFSTVETNGDYLKFEKLGLNIYHFKKNKSWELRGDLLPKHGSYFEYRHHVPAYEIYFMANAMISFIKTIR